VSDGLGTIWEAEPHTLAKHGILKSYLDAWTAILSRSPYIKASELLFVDGFAGPGEYTNGEPGSPIVALRSVLNHTQDIRKPVRFKFIENDAARHKHLSSKIVQMATALQNNNRVRIDPPILGDCDTEVRKLIASRKAAGQPLSAALFFLDQFGYSQVPMTLLRQIMQHESCEAFSYLNCQRMNQFLSDPDKWSGITNAYGDESWKPAMNMSGDERLNYLIRSYTDAICRNANVTYSWPFAMFDSSGHLIYWLVFSTNNIRGLEEMKKAMWRADERGEYRFSDRDSGSGQQSFLSTLGDEWLAGDLAGKLAGRTMNEKELNEFVLTKTPFYRFKSAINLMRKDGTVTPNEKGRFPIVFARKS
jgi:three-Cys-motif partner protein